MPFEPELLELSLAQRVLLLAAHPDDETVGAAGLLQRLIARGCRVLIAHVTDGAPADLSDARANGFATSTEYAAARRAELARAMACLGALPHLVRLGFEDQRTSFDLDRLVRTVTAIIRVWRPAVVLTHPYEGGHPDHDSAAFAAQAAIALLRTGGEDVPAVHEFTSYHLWRGAIRTGAFLQAQGNVGTLRLSPGEIEVKRRMLAAFATQQRTLALFSTEAPEHFRPAPRYDFTSPPHDGPLFYEQFPWGTDGAGWRARASSLTNGLVVEAAWR